MTAAEELEEKKLKTLAKTLQVQHDPEEEEHDKPEGVPQDPEEIKEMKKEEDETERNREETAKARTPETPPMKRRKKKYPEKTSSKMTSRKKEMKPELPKKKKTKEKMHPSHETPSLIGGEQAQLKKPTFPVLHDPEAIETPEKKWANKIQKKMFTIGRETNKEDMYSGRVLQAKMTIEERLRKEKREKMLEGLRKRMILTPMKKRDRSDDGEWMESQEDDKDLPPRTTESRSQEDATSPTKMTQTPLTSYMVHQTP